MSLGIFLCYHFQHLNFMQTRAVEYVRIMLRRSNRSPVASWFYLEWRGPWKQAGEVPEVWRYVVFKRVEQEGFQFGLRACRSERWTELKTATFCEWVNEDLLPNSSLEPGVSRKVSIERAWKWFHKQGFEALTPAKGMFFDGHEREDVIEYRGQFLRKMIEIHVEFLHLLLGSDEEYGSQNRESAA